MTSQGLGYLDCTQCLAVLGVGSRPWGPPLPTDVFSFLRDFYCLTGALRVARLTRIIQEGFKLDTIPGCPAACCGGGGGGGGEVCQGG